MEAEYPQIRLFKQCIRRFITPHALVFASEGAKEIVARYNLSPAEFLRPFGDYDAILHYDPFPENKDNTTVTITDFQLGFYDYEFMLQKPKIQLEDTNFQAIQMPDKNENDNEDESQDDLKDWSVRENIEKELLDKEYGSTPWYKKWEDQFLDNCKFGNHELIDQPVAFFYLVLIDEENIEEQIQYMSQIRSGLDRYKEGTYDSEFPNVYLCLHDKVRGISEDTALLKINKLKKRLGVKYNVCELLSFNFDPQESTDESVQLSGVDIWQNFMKSNNFVKADMFELLDRRSLLSATDREITHTVIKEVITSKILPCISGKVRHYEHAVKSTRKGFTNYFKNVFNKKDRTENDGLREDFLMNNSEKAMKNLIDLSFITQDYRTYLAYVKYPLNDFKSTKAFKHLSSCTELQFLCYVISYDSYAETKEFKTSLFDASNSYSKVKDPKWMIRNLLIVAQVAITGHNYDDAAKCYLRLAYSLSKNSVYCALFFEQAAFCYLKIDQQRKFSYFLVQAGIIYENLGFKSHSFFCFGVTEPYYTKYKWNEIRNYLYTNLSKSTFYFGNLQLSVKFFRNLLQLCCDIDDSENIKNSQKECLNQFFSVVQNWNECRLKQQNELLDMEEVGKNGITNIGFLSLPKFLDDLLEVVLNHEIPAPHQLEPNSGNIEWRTLMKQSFKHIEKAEEHRAKEDPKVADLYVSSRNETFEMNLFDAKNRLEKKTQALKRVRQVYAKEPILVKVFVKNPLMADVEITKMFLNCKFISKKKSMGEVKDVSDISSQDSAELEDFEINEQTITLNPLSTKEIILEVVPLREGEIFILGIEWVLFNAVSCNYYFPSNYPNQKAGESNTSVKLKGRENMFHYKVIGDSADLKMVFDAKLDKMFYYTEYTDNDLIIVNGSRYTVKDVYLKCSHPVFFGFTCIKVADEIPPNGKISKKLWFRAVGYVGTQNVKFLTRYRVVKDDHHGHARTTRTIKEINISNSFNFTLSTINSCIDVQERILGVHVRDVNKNIDRDQFKCMQIDQLAIVKNSEKWFFSKKEFKGKKFSKSSNKEGSIVTKYFSITPKDDDFEPFGEDRSRGNSLILEQPISHVEIDFEKPPYSDFIDHEYKFFKNIMKSIKDNENPALDTASIAISWNIYKQGTYDIKGFQCIFGIILNKQVIPEPRAITTGSHPENPLVFSVNCPTRVQGNFSEESFLSVPVALSVTNILSSRAVTFSIETPSNNRVKTKNEFFWTGVTKKNISFCKPNEVVTMNFTACFTEPGVYNLNNFIVTMYKDPTTDEFFETSADRRRCPKAIKLENKIEKAQYLIKVE